jgi:hypothetical protein
MKEVMYGKLLAEMFDIYYWPGMADNDYPQGQS